MKKILNQMMGILVVTSLVSGCGSGYMNKEKNIEDTFEPSSNITVISREEGSGTRGAFIELLNIEEKDEKGDKIDHTTEEAMITNSTSVMMTSVAGDMYGIGYISLGSLNDTVKALAIDGVEATAEHIKDNTYKIARPFQIATKGKVSEVTQDFIDYILSSEGQKIIEDNGYISQGNTGTFTSKNSSGKIVIAGSSSVTPVMEKLKEAYIELTPNVEIEIQESDSTTGMNAAIEGICDIGMASRELKESEIAAGLTSEVIGIDGIAVVVNQKNLVDELSSDVIKEIYTGKIGTWQDAMK